MTRPDAPWTSALRDLLDAVATGQTPVEDALAELRRLPIDDLGFARLDGHRALRTGFPEVIFCQGKEPDDVATIMARCAERPGPVLATRADPATFEAVRALLPDARYEPRARVIVYEAKPLPRRSGTIAVVSAGTSDIPVAEEAALTAEVMGNPVERCYDVGVAGIHRLFAHADLLARASVLVVVAGMEGALPSVVGGLVGRPVIAVPTSVGYGASFGGLSALLGMLTSCAPGVTVVNIDNGFGAGYAASLINTASAHPTGGLSTEPEYGRSVDTPPV